MGAGRHQVVDRSAGISSGHQTFADQYRIGTGIGVCDQVMWPSNATLGNASHAAGNARYMQDSRHAA